MDEHRLLEIHNLIRYKWNLVVLIHLDERPRRFMELVAAVRLEGNSISEKMLRQTLDRLRAGGAVRLVPVDERVSTYDLTAWGRRIASACVDLTSDDGVRGD